jgi:hypothetical protein
MIFPETAEATWKQLKAGCEELMAKEQNLRLDQALLRIASDEGEGQALYEHYRELTVIHQGGSAKLRGTQSRAYQALKNRATVLVEEKGMRFDTALLKVAKEGDGPALYAQFRAGSGLSIREREE